MQSLQGISFGDNYDYLEGSPHLKHQRLYQQLVSEIRSAMLEIESRGLPRRLLDVGAGDGSFVEPVLAAGWHVTASEMSRSSLERLESKYGGNTNFESVFDDGSFSSLGDHKFSLILFGSVLHHIPDYIGALQTVTSNHLNQNGAMLSFQDPIWYERQAPLTRMLSEVAYTSWRIGRGNVMRGVRNRLRRRHGAIDESNPDDMVEYHVVRNGVDEIELMDFARSRFESVRLMTYWSTQSSAWQRIGEKLGRPNTFALIASGFSDAISEEQN